MCEVFDGLPSYWVCQACHNNTPKLIDKRAHTYAHAVMKKVFGNINTSIFCPFKEQSWNQ